MEKLKLDQANYQTILWRC